MDYSPITTYPVARCRQAAAEMKLDWHAIPGTQVRLASTRKT
jgi:hypothetical protein